MTKLLTTTALLSIGYMALAQPSITMQAGVVNSNLRGDAINILNSVTDVAGDYVSQQSLTGYYFGLGTSIPIGEHISIAPSLLYSRTGASLRANLDVGVLKFAGIGAAVDLVQQNLELPVMVKAELAPGLSVMAGPQATYTIDTDVRLRASVLSINLLNQKLPVQQAFEPLNLSISGGVSYELPGGLGIAASYSHGLSRITDGRNSDTYTKSWRVGLSYAF